MLTGTDGDGNKPTVYDNRDALVQSRPVGGQTGATTSFASYTYDGDGNVPTEMIYADSSNLIRDMTFTSALKTTTVSQGESDVSRWRTMTLGTMPSNVL